MGSLQKEFYPPIDFSSKRASREELHAVKIANPRAYRYTRGFCSAEVLNRDSTQSLQSVRVALYVLLQVLLHEPEDVPLEPFSVISALD